MKKNNLGGWGFIIFSIGLIWFVVSIVKDKSDWDIIIGLFLLLWGLDLFIDDKINKTKREITEKLEELEEKIEETL
ncbi:MAG: hypothetical protein WCO35_02375 [Candidatus Nomurabacteria bacterium]